MCIRDRIQPFIDLNFGPQKHYPQFKLPVPDPENLDGLVKALQTLVPMGMRVEESVMRDRLRLPDPAKGAVLLQAPQTPAPLAPAQNHAAHCPSCLATARNQERAAQSYVDELEEEALQDWQAQMGPIVDPLEQLLQNSDSYEDFLAGLPAVMEQMDPAEVVRRMATTTFKARGLGDVSDEQDRE